MVSYTQEWSWCHMTVICHSTDYCLGQNEDNLKLINKFKWQIFTKTSMSQKSGVKL